MFRGVWAKRVTGGGDRSHLRCYPRCLLLSVALGLTDE